MKNLFATFLFVMLSSCGTLAPAFAGDRAVEGNAVADPASVVDTGYHVYMLVISVDGRPAQVMKHITSFAVKEECEANIPMMMVRLQMAFDTSNEPGVKGNLAVADAKCLSDADIAPKA